MANDAHPTPLAKRTDDVSDVEISNLLHQMNLDRPDIAALPSGSTIAVNITTHRHAADLIKRLAAKRADDDTNSQVSIYVSGKCIESGKRTESGVDIVAIAKICEGKDITFQTGVENIIDKYEAAKESQPTFHSQPIKSGQDELQAAIRNHVHILYREPADKLADAIIAEFAKQPTFHTQLKALVGRGEIKKNIARAMWTERTNCLSCSWDTIPNMYLRDAKAAITALLKCAEDNQSNDENSKNG